MSDEPRKPTLLEQGEQHVERMIAPLGNHDKAAVSTTFDKSGVKVGGAVDVGHGVAIGGEVERKTEGLWNWFVGGRWRLGKK